MAVNQEDPDYLAGREALRYFHNASLKYPAYTLTFEQLLDSYPYAVPDGLGFAINSTEMSASRVKSAMEDAAKIAQGRLPAFSSLFNALNGRSEANDFSYLDALTETAKGTAADLATGAQTVGQEVLSVASNWKWILPLAGLAIVYVYARGSRAAG